MKSILFILPYMNRGGAEIQTIILANGFLRAGFQVDMVSLRGGGALNDILDPSVVFTSLDRKHKLDIKCICKLRDLINAKRPATIFCALQFSFLYGWLASKMSSHSPHLVSSLHTTLTLGLKQELQDRLIYQYLLRSADSNIFVCNAQREYWLEKYPALRGTSTYIYNGINPNHFKKGKVTDEAQLLRERFGLPESAVIIATVAGFRKEKNHIGLVRAFASLPENAHLLLVGEGPLRKTIEEEVSRLAIVNRVHFCGLMHDVRPVLELADVLAMPSIAIETFSLAMLEAMSMEVVPVVSDIGGQKEAFVQGESGFSYAPGDENKLLGLLNHCVMNSQTLKALGKNARKRVVEKFSDQLMIQKTIKLIESL